MGISEAIGSRENGRLAELRFMVIGGRQAGVSEWGEGRRRGSRMGREGALRGRCTS